MSQAEASSPLPLDVEDLTSEVPGEGVPVLELLVEAACGEWNPESPSAEELEELVADVPLEDAWAAVEAVHRGLDHQRSEGASASEVRKARERVTRTAGRVTRAFVFRESRESRLFLRDVSHDVRSPLNSIVFLTENLYSGRSGTLNDKQRRQLGIVYSAAASVLGFVNDLLNFGSLGESDEQAGDVWFSLEGVISDVRHMVRPLTDHRGVEFRTEIRATERRVGDPQLLCRVLVNLATNAVKAVDEDGLVELVVEEAEGRDGLVIRVSDNARGTDVEELREFLEVRDVRSVTRVFRGRTYGLGLYICGKLVRRVDGTIRVEEREQGGSRFCVELPFGSPD